MAPRGLGAPDPQHARFEVKVVPFERQEFALPHPGVDGEDVERFEPVAPRGFQEGACLLGGEGRELFLGHLRRIYGLRHVAGHVQHLRACLSARCNTTWTYWTVRGERPPSSLER